MFFSAYSLLTFLHPYFLFLIPFANFFCCLRCIKARSPNPIDHGVAGPYKGGRCRAVIDIRTPSWIHSAVFWTVLLLSCINLWFQVKTRNFYWLCTIGFIAQTYCNVVWTFYKMFHLIGYLLQLKSKTRSLLLCVNWKFRGNIELKLLIECQSSSKG